MGGPSPQAVADAFDATRLTQARHLAALTKKEVAEHLGVSPAAVGQYESGVTRPRPDLIPRLAEVLSVPAAFFLSGRPHGKLDGSMAHFRSLRSTRAYQRAKAVAFVEQVWELTYALEKRVQLPLVDLPGFAGGEMHSDLPRDPAGAARALRAHWGLGTGPIGHLVRRMESHGIVVAFPRHDPDAVTVDAFSTSSLPRPIVVLTPNRFDDIYRHRFTAAHELGHLVLHGDTAAGDPPAGAGGRRVRGRVPHSARQHPAPASAPRRPAAAGRAAADVGGLGRLAALPVQGDGLLSDSAAGRAYQRLAALRDQPGFTNEPVSGYPGEQPVLLAQAFELAGRESGLSVATLAQELAWPVARVRELIGLPDRRPSLTLVP